MSHDAINAAFEIGGSMLLLLNIVRLLKDRSVKGVSIAPVVWWTAWGVWNLFYYPHLGQWASFGAGVLVAAANAAWVVLAVWCRWRAARPRRQP